MIDEDATLFVCGYSVDEAMKHDQIVIICDTCGTPNLRRKDAPLSSRCVECIHANRRTSEEIAMYKKQYRARYYAAHREELNARAKQYRAEHRVERAAYDKQYQKTHPKEIRTYVTPAGSCIKLNDWFEGCSHHHVDRDTIIHIPTPMHKGNRHNIRTGKGMDIINALSFKFLVTH